MLANTITLSFCMFALANANIIPTKCIININSGLGLPQPLYLFVNTTRFIPIKAGTHDLELNKHQQIELYCSSGFRGPRSVKSLIVTCNGKNTFFLGNKTVDFRYLSCASSPQHFPRATNRTCVGGNIFEIGFEVRDKWLPVMDICHDSRTGSTKWTHHQMSPQNAKYQRAVVRTDFVQGRFYKGLILPRLYSVREQRNTIARILGSTDIAKKMILNYPSQYSLARGHLASKTDFIFGSHQLASMYYINCAPQWQAFNDGNWLKIETGLRTFIEKVNIEIDVYTGTHDVLSYPDINGVYQKMYLAPSSAVNRIPVPKFYFKVVIAKSISSGIVFIGVNDPFATMKRVHSEYTICPDVSDKVNYIDWQRHNLTAGYSYACTVDDFSKIVKQLPTLPKVQKLFI